MRNDGVYPVRRYGAMCDGVSDDTPAFEAALAAARETGGGIVKVPTGACGVSKPLQVGTAITIAGAGRRSRVNALARMRALFVFRVEGSVGFAGGMRDLHLDGRDLARYGVSIDSWRNAAFQTIEANNLRAAFVYSRSDQKGDSAGHVFQNIWVRDDISTRPVGSGFAVFEAGEAGKVTDTAFSDCAVSMATPLRGRNRSGWELRDTARIHLSRCRMTSGVPFLASVAITQARVGSRGALMEDHNSGANIVRDFYHEQHGDLDAVAVLIEGARAKKGEHQRFNVVENANVHPTRATVVRLVNRGAPGNTLANRVILPQRTASYPGMVEVGEGVAQTRIWVIGADDAVTVGRESSSTVRDTGTRTVVNDHVFWRGGGPDDVPDPRALGLTLGDVVESRAGTFLMTGDGLRRIGAAGG
jgi:hypothetical protein